MQTDSPLSSHSFLAFLGFLAAWASAIVAKKFGLVIPPEAMVSLVVAFAAYVAGRQFKSTFVERAKLDLKELIKKSDTPLGQVFISTVRQALEDAQKKAVADAAPPKQAGFASLRVAALLCALALGAAGCQHFANCAETKVEADAMAAVVAALNNPANWEADLDALAAKVGSDVVACAIDSGLKQLEGEPPAGSDGFVMPPIFRDRDRALSRAYFFKATRGLRCAAK